MSAAMDRLEQRLIRTPGGCWQWVGRIDRDGYGRIGRCLAHREMLFAVGTDIPAGMVVDHLCRNRACKRACRACDRGRSARYAARRAAAVQP